MYAGDEKEAGGARLLDTESERAPAAQQEQQDDPMLKLASYSTIESFAPAECFYLKDRGLHEETNTQGSSIQLVSRGAGTAVLLSAILIKKPSFLGTAVAKILKQEGREEAECKSYNTKDMDNFNSRALSVCASEVAKEHEGGDMPRGSALLLAIIRKHQAMAQKRRDAKNLSMERNTGLAAAKYVGDRVAAAVEGYVRKTLEIPVDDVQGTCSVVVPDWRQWFSSVNLSMEVRDAESEAQHVPQAQQEEVRRRREEAGASSDQRVFDMYVSDYQGSQLQADEAAGIRSLSYKAKFSLKNRFDDQTSRAHLAFVGTPSGFAASQHMTEVNAREQAEADAAAGVPSSRKAGKMRAASALGSVLRGTGRAARRVGRAAGRAAKALNCCGPGACPVSSDDEDEEMEPLDSKRKLS